jgi:LEA14-like dessication related protein
MKKGAIFGLLAAAGAAFYFLRGKQELVNQLEVNLLSLSIDREKTRAALFLNIFLNVRLRLFNPTINTLSIKQIFVEFYIDGKLAGSINKTDEFTIKSNTESIINFTAKINTLNVGSQILNIVQSGEEISLFASGYIETSFGRVPFSKKF